MIERYREWYEHECWSNEKMLQMIESVPDVNRGDSRFGRALTLAAHLAACRENWLDRMTNGAQSQGPWWEETVALENLRPRYRAIESKWANYLASLTDDDLAQSFDFPAGDGTKYRWSVEGQIVQLVGHAFYHRGQIAQLVEGLGGVTEDTDYLYWAFERDPRYGVLS